MKTRASSVATTTAYTLLLVAVPTVLIQLANWPALQPPSGQTLKDWLRQPLTTEFLVGLAQLGGWTMWALLVATTATRAYTRATRALRWLPALRMPGPLQGLTAAVLGATAVSASTSGLPAHAAGPTSTTADDAAHPRQAAVASRESPSHTAPTTTRTPTPNDQEVTYTVARGDTLSEIAERCLGNADRWPEIFALNRGTRFPDIGGTLRDPNIIYPGWTLELPLPASSPTDKKTPPREQDPPTQRPDPHPSTTAPHRPTPTHSTPQSTPPPATATDTPSSTATSLAPTTAAGQTPSTDPTAPDRQREPRGLDLPGGSWVDLSLALAIAAAVTLVWAHRRRRYIPGAPSNPSHPADRDLAPMPSVVNQIRRALRTATADATARDRDAPDSPTATDTTNAPTTPHDQPPPNSPPTPVVRDLTHPATMVWPAAGLGLTGPGAHAAARGVLTAALATSEPENPHARTRVVMPSTTAATLLGTTAARLPHTPRLVITEDLDDALEILEAQTLHRSRLLHHRDVDRLTDLPAADPYEEPTPPIILLADAPARAEQARIAALLSQGDRLNIHGVLLGAWPDGQTVAVTDSGATTTDDDAPHGSHITEIGRLTVLNPTETLDLLTTLAESHTGQPQLYDPDEAAPEQAPPDTTCGPTTAVDGLDSSGAQTADTSRSDETPAARRREPPAPPATNATPTTSFTAAANATSPHHRPAYGATTTAATNDDPNGNPEPDIEAARPTGPVQVHVLGEPEIVDADPRRNLRAKSLELLVYLAVRNGEAPAETILDDLLPDAPTSKAPSRLYTYVSGLRAALRHTGGPGTYITHPQHRYALNRDTIDIDLWQMRTAIRDAERATDRHARVAALRRAVDAYRGPLAHGYDYEWIEPYREAARREAHDAALALADLLAEQPAEQAVVLNTAISHHPYSETLYQAAMMAHARRGDLDTIRALRRALNQALADIDTEPSDETEALADRLIAQVRRANTHPGVRPSPPAGEGANP
jgi:DNA-binding SARP family transcriptional activator/LysM repeat protein